VKRLAVSHQYDTARLISTRWLRTDALTFAEGILAKRDFADVEMDANAVERLITAMRKGVGVGD